MGSLNQVKLLFGAGVKLDYYPKDGNGSIITISCINPKLDIMRYLLIEKKAPIPEYAVIREKGAINEREISLRELIMERQELKDSHQQEVENEILEFLKLNGK
jgi:hypothetical protein